MAQNDWTVVSETPTSKADASEWEVASETPTGASAPGPTKGLVSFINEPKKPEPKKVYTGSVFDTQPFEPEFDPAEAEKLSRRAYAERKVLPPRRVQSMRETPAEQLDRSAMRAAVDTTIGVLQGAVAIPKGITENIPFDNPLSQFFKDAYAAGERSKSGYLQTKNVERSVQIDNVRRNQGELAASRAAFSTLFSPSGADMVSQGVGSMIPSVGMSLLNLGTKSMVAMNALANAGDAAQQTAAELANMSPEAWSNSAAYQKLREQGLNHTDAVRMLAPIYALPAQAVGLVTGAASGGTGLERALVKGGAKTARARAGRAGAELLGEEAETLGPMLAGNVTQMVLDDRKKLFEGIGQAAVETVAAAGPGAALAAGISGRPSEPVPPPARGEEAPPAVTDWEVESEVAVEPKAKVEPEIAAEKSAEKPSLTDKTSPATDVDKLAARLEAQGFPAREARLIAEQRLAPKETEAELEARLEREAIQAEGQELPVITDEGLEFFDVGKLPTRETDKGAEDAARIEQPAGREGVSVPAPRDVELSAAERAGALERAGVVPAGPDAAVAPQREAGKPVAVTTLAGEPPAKPGYVRVYHSGEAGEGKTGRWASTNKEYAANYRPDLPLFYTDIPKSDPRVNNPDYPDQNVEQGFTFNFELTPSEAAGLTEIPRTEIPATTGEPLGTETAETVEAEAQRQEAAAAPIETAPPAEAKKKRGRPAVLTAEEKTQREQERKSDRAVRERHRRAIAQLVPQLQKSVQPLDEGQYENDEALQQAEADQRSERVFAVRELLRVSEEAGLKPAGKAARKAIKDAGISDKEIADIKRGMEVARRALADKTNLLGPASAKGAATTVADPAFSKTTTGAQAIAHIIRTGNPFQKLFAQRIRNFVGNVRIVVLEKGDPVPEQLKSPRNAQHWERSRALFIENFTTGDRVIYARGGSFGTSQGVNNITMLHELWHAATVKKMALAQMFIDKGINLNTPLVQAYNDLINTMHAAQDKLFELNDDGLLPPEIKLLVKSTDASIVADPREFVAYGTTDREFQEFLMQAEGTIDRPNLFTRFVNSLRKLFGMPTNSLNALSDLLVASDSLLRASLPGRVALEGEVSAEQVTPQQKAKADRTAEELDKDVQEAKRKVAESRMGTEAQAKGIDLMQAARDPKKVLELLKTLWDGASYAQRQFMVKVPTLDVLADWTKDSVPRIGDIQRHMQEMNGMSTKFLEGAQQVIEAERNVFKALPQERQAIENLVYESTLAQYDPSDTTLKVRNTALDTDFRSLSPAGQDLYKLLRDYYEDVHAMYRLLLDEQVQNLENVSAEDKQNLMVMIRQTFETGDRIKPFFPLVRRGDFWLSVGEGPNRQFYMFESRAERNAFRKTVKGTVKEGNDIGELRRSTQDASTLLKSFFEAIDQQDLTDQNTKEGLKDAVYQIYLQTMPEQSFRKMFIHRKGVSGFSTDLVRNTATTASRMAVQLARLKYAPILRNDLSAARSSIEGREELSPFVLEVQRRIDSALSGQEGGISEAIAGFANKASYLWYMSSASSALIQPFSIYVSGLPVLAANHGGNWVGAAQELGKMLTYLNQYGITKQNIDGSLSYTSPSIANNPNLPEDERQAVRAMVERGVQDSTYASAVWGYSRVPSENIDGIYEKGKRAGDLLVGGLMHTTERLTREMVYLASYRLGKKRGLTTEEAINQAVADTNEALSDYDISNRPRWMQKGLGKIAFQFKMYPLHMTLLALTNFKRMLPFLNEEGKLAAAQKFFGLMGTSATLAGASNMLFFSPIMSLVGWAWKQMADDDELPEELKDKDYETWFRTVFLPETFGDIKLGGVSLADLIDRGPLNALTGFDIAGRTGLNDLWGRDMKEAKTARDSFTAWVIDTFGGPSTSLALGMIDAYEAYALGDYQKALEKSTPAVIRNLIIANKYADEGIKTARGSELVSKEDLTKGELFGQAIGFRPDRAATAQAQAFKLTGIEQKVINQRDRVMRMLNTAHKKGDDDAFDRIMETEVSKFNTKNPEYAIDADDIFNSILKQTELRESAQAGVNLTEKNARLMGEAVDSMLKKLEPKK